MKPKARNEKMKPRFSIKNMIAVVALTLLTGTLAGTTVIGNDTGDAGKSDKAVEKDDYKPKTDVELRRQLSRLQYQVGVLSTPGRLKIGLHRYRN